MERQWEGDREREGGIEGKKECERRGHSWSVAVIMAANFGLAH